MAGTMTHQPSWTAEELAGLLKLVHSALHDATAALLDDPAEAAERARTAAQIIGGLRQTMEEDAGGCALPAAIPAPQLRPLLLGAHTSTEVECLTEVTVQLIELAWLRRELPPLGPRMLGPLRAMAADALDLVEAASKALGPGVGLDRPVKSPATSLARHQHLLYEGLVTGEQPVGSEDVADAVLISCQLLRSGHHAESVIDQAALLTGSTRERRVRPLR